MLAVGLGFGLNSGWGGSVANAQPAAATPSGLDRITEIYLSSDWSEIDEALAQAKAAQRSLNTAERERLGNMEEAIETHQGEWWSNYTGGTSGAAAVEVFGRGFTVNRISSEWPPRMMTSNRWVDLGKYERVNVITGINVSMNPMLRQNSQRPDPAQTYRYQPQTEADGFNRWHWYQIGYFYPAAALGGERAGRLRDLQPSEFDQLCHFFGHLTIYSHSKPSTRRSGLFNARVNWFPDPSPANLHHRAQHVFVALLVNDILNHPEAWPSVHLPATVPADHIELNTADYILSHWGRWSYEEAERFADLARNLEREQADTIITSLGRVELANDLEAFLVANQDRTAQIQRERWITRRLNELIEAGLTDLPDPEFE